MNIRKNIITAIILLIALSVLAIAQNAPARPAVAPAASQDRPPGRRPGPLFPDHALNILSPEMRFDSKKVVKDAPYSATATTESVQTLSNGARITHKTSAVIYRDSQGRTRREVTLDSIGPFATAGEPAQLIFINDPVTGVHYILDQRNHTARKMAFPPQRGDGPPHRPAPSQAQNIKTESLGNQTIEGVDAEGVRSIITIPEGQIGNDRPIEIVSERWDSTELQTVVLSKHNDPLLGETVYRLTNINRAEPAQTLFDVPSDYKVIERPMRGMKKSND
ncbi:MAG: hypothetical protein J2P21_20040 [Chloracidobacterium sp.]|nr:hypothetical protein [Chloracidobacterium sp.]